MTGVYLLRQLERLGSWGFDLSEWPHTGRIYTSLVGKGLRFHVLCLDYWCGNLANGSHCRTQMVLAQNREILFTTDVKIYMQTFVKSLHSRTSLWKSGNFGNCFNVTQSCNLISPLLQKKQGEHSHLGLCFFFQKWCRQKPNHFTISNTETHPSPREKNSLPLHLDNLVLCWFWKYSRTSIT